MLAIVVDEPLAYVEQNRLLGAERERLATHGFERGFGAFAGDVVALAEIGGHCDHIVASIDQFLQKDGSVQTARVGEDDATHDSGPFISRKRCTSMESCSGLAMATK